MSQLTIECRIAPDLLAEVADLRARGRSWEGTAEEVGWDAGALRRAVRAAPEYDTLYRRAAREFEQESAAEMLLTFRSQLRHPDPDLARKAAEAVAKHLAGERQCRTRLVVERMRADVARARLEAKRPQAESPAPEPPAPALPPEAVHRPEAEALHARRAADTRAVVWLWGGAHKVGGVEPDAATDVPLVLFRDDTVAGRNLYWAARFPLPGDPLAGPFPAPPQPPPPVLTPEQTGQLAGTSAARAAGEA